MTTEKALLLILMSSIIIFCAIKIITSLRRTYKNNIIDAITQYRNAENSKHRAEFFIRCECIGDFILQKTKCKTITEFLESKGYHNIGEKIPETLESINKYLYRHAYCSRELIDAFCIAGLFNILLLCNKPSDRKDAKSAPWFSYTLHGEKYPKNEITHFLGVLETEEFRLDRLYMLVNDLFFDGYRMEDFIEGSWLRHIKEKDFNAILAEVEREPEAISSDVVDAFDGLHNIPPLQITDKNRITLFIKTLYTQME